MEELGDGSGVSRDVYSSFWQEIANCYLIGEKERVPFVRHDLYKEEWEAIVKIIEIGFIDTHYFPLILSQAFVMYCLFGEASDEVLLESFLRYLSPDESKLIELALSCNCESELFTSDEFMECMEKFKVRTLASKNNTRSVILEVARQELIQKPHIMATCWHNSFSSLKQKDEFKSVDAVKALYDTIAPTAKKVLEIPRASPKDDSEQDSFNYFKRYIIGLEMVDLRKLLKFLTGSDIIIVDSLEITFSKPERTFSRRPVAHTCLPFLELPATYNNFCELREEFSNILQQTNWEMDII